MKTPEIPPTQAHDGFSVVVDDVWARAGNEQVLRGVDLAILPGEYVAISGASGSGKTTLANTILGLAGKADKRSIRSSIGQLITGRRSEKDIMVQEGTVYYGDVDVYSLNEQERTALRAEQVGYVPQKPYLSPGRTAMDSILEPTRLNGRKVNTALLEERAELLGVADHLHKTPEALSGGQQQRINILRGIVHDPSLLVIDEPTSQLHPELKEQTNNMLLQLAKNLGRTVIVITHEKTTAERILSLQHGRVEPADNRQTKKVGDF